MNNRVSFASRKLITAPRRLAPGEAAKAFRRSKNAGFAPPRALAPAGGRRSNGWAAISFIRGAIVNRLPSGEKLSKN
jgi:hypothetical protein